MTNVLTVVGPRDGGPGERQRMLELAQQHLEAADGVVRVDAPGRGGGEESAGGLRPALEPAVPALQSGSLFGGAQGVLIVDAQNLLKNEAEVIAELVDNLADGVKLAVVTVGSVPAPLSKSLKSAGDSVTVKKMRERDAGEWLAAEVKARKLGLDREAREALLHVFGSDLAGLGQALDQLELSEAPLDSVAIRERFKTRPDEPVWLYADAVAAGNVGDALRRLSDFLTHSHPLQLLAFLENDLRRRSLALAAPDLETLAEWSGVRSDHYPIKKAWNARNRTSESELVKALDAISRADHHLKSASEETHRVTMERLTVALCRWYGGPAARK